MSQVQGVVQLNFTGDRIFRSFEDVDEEHELLYFDPSYAYGKYSNTKIDLGNKRRRITPYRPMTYEELKEIPISKMSTKNSTLLVWTTGPHIPTTIKLIPEWGFEYKTIAFSWMKRTKNTSKWHFGYGHYSGSNTELCLLATKGKGLKVQRHDIPQISDNPVGEHSEKPDIFRQRAVQMFGKVSRLEGFARIKPHGWNAVGDDVKLLNKPLEAFSCQ